MENRTNFISPCYENLVINESSYKRRIYMVSIVFCSLWSVLGTVGNGLVIFIMGFRMKKTVHTVWILNLAIADFTFCLFVPFPIVYAAQGFNWPFGPIMCKIERAIAFLNLFGSVYTMTVISIDRCVSVRCPVWAQNHRTPRLAFFVVLGIWILALGLSSPYAHYREMYSVGNKNCCDHDQVTMKGGFVPYVLVVVIQFIFGFTIPFTVIMVCYGTILVRLKRDHLSQSSRPFKVITAVILAFFVCWFPFHLFSLLKLKISRDSKTYMVVFTGYALSYSLAYFNSCLNPILYFCLGHNFKGKLRCSLLSALANAFTEDSNLDNTKTSKSSAELD